MTEEITEEITEITTIDGKPYKLIYDYPLTLEQRSQTISEIRRQTVQPQLLNHQLLSPATCPPYIVRGTTYNNIRVATGSNLGTSPFIWRFLVGGVQIVGSPYPLTGTTVDTFHDFSHTFNEPAGSTILRGEKLDACGILAFDECTTILTDVLNVSFTCPIGVTQNSSRILTATIFGGVAPYIVTWNITRPDTLIEHPTGNAINYTFAQMGTYRITVTVASSSGTDGQTYTTTECTTTITCISSSCDLVVNP